MNSIENQIYNNSIKSGISCLVTNWKNEILMVFEKHSNNRKLGGQLSLIFGNIEEGESPKQASIREVKEESGFDLHDVDFVSLKQVKFLSSLYNLYMFKSTTSNLTCGNFIQYDTKGYKFLSLYELLNLGPHEIRPGTLEVIISTLFTSDYSNINIAINGSKYDKFKFLSLRNMLRRII
ncbi:MAG: NUDIX hydrolase [Candidatus Absconditabacteria bacterium]